MLFLKNMAHTIKKMETLSPKKTDFNLHIEGKKSQFPKFSIEIII